MSKSIFLFIPAIFIVLLLASISSKYQLVPKTIPIPVLPTAVPEAAWQTYQDQNVSFVYPSTFEKEPLLFQESGYTQELNDNQNNLFLSFSSKGNYSQITGKAYSNIDEYIGMPYKVKEVVVDGQPGRQPLPRAGSENVFSAVFFSKDSAKVYTLELKAGDTPFNTPVKKVAEGESIFIQILSTFKFIDQNVSPTPTPANDHYLLNSATKKIGGITKAYFKDNKPYIDIDYIDWLTDNNNNFAGTKACVTDKKCQEYDESCEIDKNGNCVPTDYSFCDGTKCAKKKCGVEKSCLTNGYYIRNTNPLIRSFELSPNAKISVLKGDYSSYQTPSFEEFTKIAVGRLVWIDFVGNKISVILEQYRP